MTGKVQRPGEKGGRGKAIPLSITLLRSALAGERQALEALLATLRPRFVRFVLRQTANADLAEEIAQEALMKVYEKIGAVREPAAFEGWAFQVLSNSLRDHFRQARRAAEFKERLTDTLRHTTPLDEPARWAAHNELTALVGWALNRLDEKHRLVLQMHEIDGLDHASIALLLDVPEGTVWSRLHYARRMLRDMLKEAT